MLLRMKLPAQGKKLIAELLDGDKAVFADTINPLFAANVTRLIKAVSSYGYQLTHGQVLGLQEGGELELIPIAGLLAENHEACNLRIICRKKHQPASTGTVFSNFADALAGGADDDVLEWDDIEQLAILDVDYHDLPPDQRPQPFQLEALALIIRPRPKLYWFSKGGGLHLLFAPTQGLTAEEAAACGGFHFKQLDPKCTFEVIARTSYPPGGAICS
jgi:hypothetical protein